MRLGVKIAVAFVLALVAVGAVGIWAYTGIAQLKEANNWVVHTHEVMGNLEHVLSMLDEAQADHRGFLLTGEDRYLEPYNTATGEIRQDIDQVASLTADNPHQQPDIEQLRKLSADKLDELRETVKLEREGKHEQALQIIRSDRGKAIMDDIRKLVDGMESREQTLLQKRNQAADEVAARTTQTMGLGVLLAVLVLAVAAVVVTRTMRLAAPSALPKEGGRKWPRIVIRYAFAVAMVGLATLLRWWLDRYFGAEMPTFITWYPAVLVAASIAGGGPGVLATVLAALAADYWFIEPYGRFGIAKPSDAAALGIFVGTCVFVCILMERLRRARYAEAVSVTQERELALLNMGQVMIKDMDHRVVRWSEGNHRLYGFDARETQGQITHDFLKTHFDQPLEQIHGELLKVGYWEGEVTRQTKDGTQLSVSILWALRRGEEGEPPSILEVSTDITKRKLAEEQNKRNELRLESLMRISQHGAGTIQELLDFALAEAIVLTGSKIGYIYHYDENKKEFTLNTWSKGVMEECTIVEQQTIYKLEKTGVWGEAVRQAKPIVINDFHAPNPLVKGYPQGHSPLHKFMTIPVFSDGHIVGVVGVANKETDYEDADVRQLTLLMDSVWKITDRKRAEDALRDSEQRLRTVLDSLPVAVFLSDRNGNVVFTNRSVERIWGISTHVTKDQYGQYKGRWVDGGKPVEPEQWALARALQTGEPFTNDLVEVDAPEGKKKIIYNFALPIHGEGGQLLGAVAVTEDITERFHAQEQIRLAKEAAEHMAEDLARSNKDLEQFAYVSSHDLQEPLRMVTGFMGLLEKKYSGTLDATGEQYIHFAVDGANRMQRLIDDLLAYSRVGSKGGRHVATDCGQALERALANLRVSIEQSGARITRGPLPTVVADGVQLTQLFQNLVGNAIKFRANGPAANGPAVDIQARLDGGYWLFSVKDNGIGIDPEFKDKVFVIFQRLHTKDKYAGTGIGLAICKKIVDGHGGRIWVESTLGQGATFYFTLPK
jgi:PAS domain S-box-containing protein